MAYYFRVEDVKRTGTKVFLFGPFLTEEDAAKAKFFHRPSEDFDRDLEKVPLHVLMYAGISFYDSSEIESLTSEPDAYGYASVRLYPASKLKPHLSWTKMANPNQLFQHYLRAAQS